MDHVPLRFFLSVQGRRPRARAGLCRSMLDRAEGIRRNGRNAGAVDMSEGHGGRGLAVLTLVACLPEGGMVNVAQSLER